MTASTLARAVGINHVALEVGDIDEALAFYRQLFAFELRGRVGSTMAFIDLGDQFLALAAGRRQPADDDRHFGLVVDDKQAVREVVDALGVAVLPGGGLNFRDPWGNRIEVVQYDEVQFTKTAGAARKLALDPRKTSAAQEEIRDRGLA
jgi:catechol 2,3-dioxygenase-like lactoylglutathione lyase family enzyme